MVFALGANAILFSARSFQHNLASVDRDTGGIVSLADLGNTEAQIADLNASIQPQRSERDLAQQAFDAANKDALEAQRAFDNSLAALENEIAAQEQRIGLATPAPAPYDAGLIAQRLERLSAQPRLKPEQRAAIRSLRDAAAKVDQLEGVLEDKIRRSDAAEMKLKEKGVAVAAVDGAIARLKGRIGANYEQIRNEAEALERSSLYGIGATLVGMHPAFLSTMLVCLMGGLGGLLFLFPAYVANRFPVTFVVIIVRLVFGMVTALAFYIVANATLAGFAFNPGGDGGQSATTSLNPFTVSLLGIIAGVMADDIAEWIHNRGRDILGGGRGRTAAPRAAPVETGPPPKGSVAGGAPAGASPGAVGLLDPFASAAADAAQTRIGASHDGPEPPKGGVVRRS
jgi:hypothetical protein